jgi:hypothetical protein
MKKLITIILLTLSFNSYSLGGYDSLNDTQKKVLKSIVSQLGIKDLDNSLKYKIYNNNSDSYSKSWNSYWLGLAELSASKLKDGKEKGFIEVMINNEEQGTLFLTYIYNHEVKQITVLSKQIRYSDKKLILDEFAKRKQNTDVYETKHETSNYGLLQEKGKISFELFHVGNDAASLVYNSYSIIDVL